MSLSWWSFSLSFAARDLALIIVCDALNWLQGDDRYNTECVDLCMARASPGVFHMILDTFVRAPEFVPQCIFGGGNTRWQGAKCHLSYSESISKVSPLHWTPHPTLLLQLSISKASWLAEGGMQTSVIVNSCCCNDFRGTVVKLIQLNTTLRLFKFMVGLSVWTPST